MDYVLIFDLKFVYFSNGDVFLEYDFIIGKEIEIKLEDFLIEEELYNCYFVFKNYIFDEFNIIEILFYYDVYSYELRYY